MQTFDEIQFKQVSIEFLKEIERAGNQIKTMLGRDELFGDGPQFNMQNARDMLRSANEKLDKLFELRKNPLLTSRAPDAACVAPTGKYLRHWFGRKQNCQRCGQPRR